jgi:L-cystine transport system permease protein
VAAAIPLTLELVAVSLIISIPLAFLMARVNLNTKSVLSKVFRVYISFVRSTPVVIIIFLLYHLLPMVLSTIVKALGIKFNVYSISDMYYGYVVLSFVTIPTLSEVFRAGLLTVPKTQFEAASSIGMTTLQSYFHVIIPQAVITSLPVICTSVTSLVKTSSLVFIMTIREITGTAKIIAADSLRYIEVYIVIFVMYIILNLSIECIFRYFEHRCRKYAF